MFKIFIFFLLFYLVYKFFKKFFFTNSQHKEKYNDTNQINGEKIVPCNFCNVYFPESNAILMDGKKFCSKECVNRYIEKKAESR